MKKQRNLHKAAMILALAVIALRVYSIMRDASLVHSISSKIIRFHVIANSDSKEDQDLKLKVRDAIGSSMQTELKDVKDAKSGRKIMVENMDKIVATAEEIIRQEGYTYDVDASLEYTNFPPKTYGSFTFPEGEYEALRVIIGDGKGENWWCVMYPNLCFLDSKYEVVDKQAQKNLEKALSPNEYAQLMENKNYEIKFKWLSFLNN